MNNLEEIMGSTYLNRLNIIKEKMNQVFAYQTPKNFTEHSLPHIINIIQNINKIIMHSVTPLCPSEAFLLEVAVYLHDIGRMLDDQNNFCTDHGQNSQDIILENYEKLGLSFAEGSYISRITVSHTRKRSDLEQIPDSVILIDRKIRLRLLCVLLRIGDILDLRSNRAPELVMQYRNIEYDSLKHWIKHLSFTGYHYNFDNGILEIGAIAVSKENLKILRQAIMEIESEFQYAKNYLYELGVKYTTTISNIVDSEKFDDLSNEQELLDYVTKIFFEQDIIIPSKILKEFRNSISSLDIQGKKRDAIIISSLKFNFDIDFWMKACSLERNEVFQIAIQYNDEDILFNFLNIFPDIIDAGSIIKLIFQKHGFDYVKVGIIRKCSIDIINDCITFILSDKSPIVKRILIRRLNNFPDESIREQCIIKLSQDSHPDVREELAKYISNNNSVKYHEILKSFLSDDFGRVRLAAKKGLQNEKEKPSFKDNH